MKFRTKIWSLPASATIVLIAGVIISAVIGAKLSADMNTLRSVDDPFLARVTQLSTVTENVRLTVQTAAAEGDMERLTDLQTLVKSGHEALDAMAVLSGKAEATHMLRSAFDAYQTAAGAAAKGMIDKSADAMASVQKMQSTQKALDPILVRAKEDARLSIDARYESAPAGVRSSLIATVLTGLVVLVALGVASWIIVRSVWKDLGEEPARLRESVRTS